MAEREKVERKWGDLALLWFVAVATAFAQVRLTGLVGAKVWSALVMPFVAVPVLGWQVFAAAILLRQLVFLKRTTADAEYLTNRQCISRWVAEGVTMPLAVWLTLWLVTR